MSCGVSETSLDCFYVAGLRSPLARESWRQKKSGKAMRNGKSRTYEYTVFFESNEHGGYTVTVPALPGLVTEGKNLEDARQMAEDAIRCYIGGLKKAKQKVPVERDTAQLRISILA